MPLKESVKEYFEREVKPHVTGCLDQRSVKDAKDNQVGKVGYEIPLTRHFYRYVAPEPLDKIEAEIAILEQDIVRMLREVVGCKVIERQAVLRHGEARK